MEECIELSKRFAKLLSDELDVPVFLYAESQTLNHRKELSQIRLGEYEMLSERLKDSKFTPDFGNSISICIYIFLQLNFFFIKVLLNLDLSM